jgi:hypothetical protein
MYIQRLRQRLKEFEADNQNNFKPIQAVFRLDAGFGTRENVAWLIEMDYEVYTKPYSDWLTPAPEIGDPFTIRLYPGRKQCRNDCMEKKTV